VECVSGGRQCRSRRTLWKGVKRWVGMGGVDADDGAGEFFLEMGRARGGQGRGGINF
jgi:hypothetical protein